MENVNIDKNMIENLILAESKMIKAAEPATWIVILKTIGKGILKGLGAKIFKDLFDKGYDLKSLLQNMLVEIDRIVSFRIEEAFLQQALLKAETLNVLVRDYVNSPSNHRLIKIEEESRWLAVQFANYRHLTYNEYIVAVTYRLFAFKERLINGELSERNNIDQTVTESINHIMELNEEWQKISDSRFTVVEKQYPIWHHDLGIIDYYGQLWINENGKRISRIFEYEAAKFRPQNLAQVNSEFEKIKKERYQIDIIEGYVKPADIMINYWQGI